jgi:hypothetical protein
MNPPPSDWEIFRWALLNEPCKCQLKVAFLRVNTYLSWQSVEVYDWRVVVTLNFPPRILIDIPNEVYESYSKKVLGDPLYFIPF